MKSYKGFKIVCDEIEIEIFKNIIDNKFLIEKEYKNDNRTYVAKIKYNGKYYILKKIYIRKKFKKILSIFKEGESIRTFKNTNKFNKKIPELVKIYGAALKRKSFFIIEEEFILMEYVKGKILVNDENCRRILESVKKIHALGRFHGDCNPGNFICDSDDKIYIIDTKLKKMGFGNYRAHYDILTLFKYFKNKPEYPYKKNIFYKIAFIVRQYRNKKR